LTLPSAVGSGWALYSGHAPLCGLGLPQNDHCCRRAVSGLRFSLSLSLSLSLFPFWPQNFPVYGTPITTTTTTTTTEYTYPSHNSVAEVVELRCTRKACVGVLIPLCEVFD